MRTLAQQTTDTILNVFEDYAKLRKENEDLRRNAELWKAEAERWRSIRELQPEIAEASQSVNRPKYRRQWFVRGTRPDGTKWESAVRHDTRERAYGELESWTKNCPNDSVLVWCETLPLSRKSQDATPTAKP